MCQLVQARAAVACRHNQHCNLLHLATTRSPDAGNSLSLFSNGDVQNSPTDNVSSPLQHSAATCSDPLASPPLRRRSLSADAAPRRSHSPPTRRGLRSVSAGGSPSGHFSASAGGTDDARSPLGVSPSQQLQFAQQRTFVQREVQVIQLASASPAVDVKKTAVQLQQTAVQVDCVCLGCKTTCPFGCSGMRTVELK